MTQPNDNDFAQSPAEFATPADPVYVIEPAFRQWRAVQQRAVYFDQAAAAAAGYQFDQIAMFWQIFRVQKGTRAMFACTPEGI